MKSVVALVRCTSYERHEVHAAVGKAIDLLGGASSLFTPGERIVLKPNILSGTPPELCVTTHPSVFAAVAQILKGEDVDVVYGDSPAVGTCGPHAEKAGLAGVARELSVPLADFDNGRTVTHRSAAAGGSFPVANGVLDADGVVSIPKLKTHNLTRMTGAVKNQYGCIPGMAKARFHARFLLPRDFSAFVVDVTGYIRPRLYVMDAVYAMEGDGPNTGNPKKLGVILASTDPVACDAIGCALMNLPVDCVPTCEAGERAGLGTCRIDSIQCVGEPLESLVDKSFKVERRAPKGLTGTGLRLRIKQHMAPRPVLESHLCTRCGKCVAICPVEPKAVDWTGDNRDEPPRHDYARCIRCFCCQEACPSHAIRVKTPALGRIVPVVVPLFAFALTKRNLLVRWLKAHAGRRGEER